MGKAIPSTLPIPDVGKLAEGEAICIERKIFFLLALKSVFGWGTKQEFPISFGLNSKEGMDYDDFLSTL